MEKLLAVCILSICFSATDAQFLKTIKDRVNKTVDKKIDKAVGIDKPTSEIEKKEDAASSKYSYATENNEACGFVVCFLHNT